MSTTNLDVIRGALQLLGVLPEGIEPSAEQAEQALAVLNDFLEDWSADGLDVGQWPQTELAAECPAPSGAIQAIKATLAIQLAPYYEKVVNPITALNAQAGRTRLLRDGLLAGMSELDTSHLPGGISTGNIETG
jgi:hypothetical protein